MKRIYTYEDFHIEYDENSDEFCLMSDNSPIRIWFVIKDEVKKKRALSGLADKDMFQEVLPT